MGISNEEWSALREDVGYIKAKIEVIEVIDGRVRSLEQKWWQFPVTALAAVLSSLLGHHH